MAENTRIAWTDFSFNPVWGCTKVAAGCRNCYAERDAARFYPQLKLWGKTGDRRVANEKYWLKPEAWNRRAKKEGKRFKVFCASMADVFEDHPVWNNGIRDRLFKLIERTPYLDWQLLTKRPGFAARWLLDFYTKRGNGIALPNVWVGTSISGPDDLTYVDELLGCVAVEKFVSIEPMIAPFRDASFVCDLDWVIAGGESATSPAGARPCRAEWFHPIVEACAYFGVPLFVKQLGSNVLARNDDGFSGDTPHDYPDGTDVSDSLDGGIYQGADVRVLLRDRAGSDPAEWPPYINVRQFPVPA